MLENEEQIFPFQLNKAVQLDGDFNKLLNEIKNADIHLPLKPNIVSGMIDPTVDNSAYLITQLEDNTSEILDIESGCELAHQKSILISGYDESIAYYASLEGKVAYVSHSLVTMYEGQYYPLNHINLIFCTKSNLICDRIAGAIYADRWDVDTTINVEISKQKRDFLVDNAIQNSILFIDGPLLAGDGSFTFYEAIDKLLERSIIPIFIVKNSFSTLLIDNLEKIRGMYNSDLHYANEVLEEGARTSFFEYNSETGNKSKVFCYLKHKNQSSPIRVEIPTKVFNKNRLIIDQIMNLIYYLIKVQGSSINPQIRPIAIAEMFARETLALIDINKDSIQMKLTATMNEQRGME